MACGKKIHDKQNAENILFWVKKGHSNRMGDKKTTRKYYCNECQGWHLTSMSNKEFYKSKRQQNEKSIQKKKDHY